MLRINNFTRENEIRHAKRFQIWCIHYLNLFRLSQKSCIELKMIRKFFEAKQMERKIKINWSQTKKGRDTFSANTVVLKYQKKFSFCKKAKAIAF